MQKPIEIQKRIEIQKPVEIQKPITESEGTAGTETKESAGSGGDDCGAGGEPCEEPGHHGHAHHHDDDCDASREHQDTDSSASEHDCSKAEDKQEHKDIVSESAGANTGNQQIPPDAGQTEQHSSNGGGWIFAVVVIGLMLVPWKSILGKK